MIDAFHFMAAHPIWLWLAVGAVLLVVELATGSGYLLWPAGAAGAVALLTLVTPLDDLAQILIFSALTIAGAYLGRRYMPVRARHPGDDLNDKTSRLLGRKGHVSAPFRGGEGRVFVDGSDWAADLAPGSAEPAVNDAIHVVAVSGSRLTVKGD